MSEVQEVEAGLQDYLQRKRLPELFKDIVHHILMAKPENAVLFTTDYLARKYSNDFQQLCSNLNLVSKGNEPSISPEPIAQQKSLASPIQKSPSPRPEPTNSLQKPVSPRPEPATEKPVSPRPEPATEKPVSPRPEPTTEKPVSPRPEQKPVSPRPEPATEKPVSPRPEPATEKPVSPRPEPATEKPVSPRPEPATEKPVSPRPEPATEKPVSPRPEPTPVVEKPVSPRPEPTPVVEKPVSPRPEPTVVEKPVSPRPEPTVVEKPVSPRPEPTPVVEKPVSPRPEPTPVVEKPVSPRPEPAAEKPVSPRPEPTPVVEKPVSPRPEPTVVEKPVSPRPEPAAEKPVSPRPEPTPVVEKPVSPRPEPAAEKPVSPRPEPTPVVEKPVSPRPEPAAEKPVSPRPDAPSKEAVIGTPRTELKEEDSKLSQTQPPAQKVISPRPEPAESKKETVPAPQPAPTVAADPESEDDEPAAGDDAPLKAFNKTRKAGVSAESVDAEKMKDQMKNITNIPKSPEVAEKLFSVVGKSALLRSLDEDQKLLMVNAFSGPIIKEPGEDIIVQGAIGDVFYLIEDGLVDVHISKKGNPPIKVHTYKPGDAFGELAIMYNAPRAATCRAQTPTTIWALDRISFKCIVVAAAMQKREMYQGFLAGVPILGSMSELEILTLADSLAEEKYPDGSVICNEGEEGNYFYIVKEGVAECFKNINGTMEVVKTISTGDYFGELALLTPNPRQATVKAKGPLKVLAIDRATFTRVLGPLSMRTSYD